VPCCTVQRIAKDIGQTRCAVLAYVARAGSCIEREARIRGGVKRVERGIKAALLVKSREAPPCSARSNRSVHSVSGANRRDSSGAGGTGVGGGRGE
jgi:hypothetical protein